MHTNYGNQNASDSSQREEEKCIWEVCSETNSIFHFGKIIYTSTLFVICRLASRARSLKSLAAEVRRNAKHFIQFCPFPLAFFSCIGTNRIRFVCRVCTTQRFVLFALGAPDAGEHARQADSHTQNDYKCARIVISALHTRSRWLLFPIYFTDRRRHFFFPRSRSRRIARPFVVHLGIGSANGKRGNCFELTNTHSTKLYLDLLLKLCVARSVPLRHCHCARHSRAHAQRLCVCVFLKTIIYNLRAYWADWVDYGEDMRAHR